MRAVRAECSQQAVTAQALVGESPVRAHAANQQTAPVRADSFALGGRSLLALGLDRACPTGVMSSRLPTPPQPQVSGNSDAAPPCTPKLSRLQEHRTDTACLCPRPATTLNTTPARAPPAPDTPLPPFPLLCRHPSSSLRPPTARETCASSRVTPF